MIAHLVAACAIATAGFQENKGMLEQSSAWLQNAWTTAQKQGKPAAERVIRQFPQRFKALPRQAAELQRRCAKNLKLEERKAMAQELWRIRQGLNLMALIDSGLLEQLTGIDTKMLKVAQQQVASLSQRLSSK